MANQPILGLEKLQTAADRVVDYLGTQLDTNWEVATWTSDDFAIRYLLGRSAMLGPFQSYFLRIEPQLSEEPAPEPSVFGFTNVTHDVDIRGPAADEFAELKFPDDREAAKRVILSHLLTAPIVLPPESPKPLEYVENEHDKFVEIVVNEASLDPTMEALATLVWKLEKKSVDGHEYLWELVEDIEDEVTQRYGVAASASTEAYYRCLDRLWEAGRITETG